MEKSKLFIKILGITCLAAILTASIHEKEIKNEIEDQKINFDFSLNKLIEEEIRNNEIERLEEIKRLEIQASYEKDLAIETGIKTPSRGESRGELFITTAYDLSIESCGKDLNHPNYGLTASGYSLKGMTREDAMTVATDPKIIPLNTKIHIEFIDEDYKEFDGVYISRDTGGLIKGKKIDIFMGDFNKKKTDQSVWNFGKVKAKITILKQGYINEN